jgi:hemolysin activation/secretion protein
MKHTLTRLVISSALAASAACSWRADAVEQNANITPDAPIRFDITRFEVTGNTLLDPNLLRHVLAPFAGSNRDFGDVQRALEALEAAYHQRGYNVVQVEIPEQELNRGVVLLKVVQSRIGNITVEGNQHFDQANIRRSLPGLREGETPNIKQVSNSLKLANENPAKKTSLQLESGDKDGEVNAALKVSDDKVWKAGVTLDNTGTKDTGKTHLGVLLQHDNVFGLDHVLSVQYTTTLEKPSKVSVYGLGYHIPLYWLGDSIDLFGSYSDVDSGTVAAGLVNLQVSGKGAVYGARYNQSLARVGNYEPKLVYGLDYKAFQNGVQFLGQQLGRDVTVHPASIGYTGAWTLAAGEASFAVTALRNIPGGNLGRTADFNAVRIGATANYSILHYGATYSRVLPADWQLRLALSGQYTRDALIPGEQFGAGGASSVRGFAEREVANDYGYQVNAEIYTPNLCAAIRSFATQCRVLAFYDGAHAARNKPLPGEITDINISSVGVGLRLAVERYVTFQFDYGHAINVFGSARIDKNRFHFRMSVAY